MQMPKISRLFYVFYTKLIMSNLYILLLHHPIMLLPDYLPLFHPISKSHISRHTCHHIESPGKSSHDCYSSNLMTLSTSDYSLKVNAAYDTYDMLRNMLFFPMAFFSPCAKCPEIRKQCSYII